MLFPLLIPPIRRASLIAVALFLAAGLASAQSAPSQDQSSATGYSSSQAGLSASGLQLAEFALPDNPAPGTSASGGGSGQYGNGGGYGGGGKHAFLHNWAFEAGAGFNGPVGNDTGNGGGISTPVITWGGNFTVGGGLRFSNRISVLAEYQFMGDKLPGAMLSEWGVPAGNSHINSITGSPVIHLFPKWTNGVYLVGGWGWYHKSTNFQEYAEEESYYGIYDVPVTVYSIASSQWGGNLGLGLYHRLGGGMYGNDAGHTELFAEARYTFLHSPPNTSPATALPNGFGTTELIPVTLGIRF